MPTRAQKAFGSSKADIAKLMVDKLAFEAYPSWAQANPSKACPNKLEDLTEYTNSKDVKDPWATAYRMLCGSDAPAGAKGLAVVSAGEDQKFGTEDDVKSWE